MPINMNLVTVSNLLEQVKGEVTARVERSKDDHGNLNSDVFKLRNQDITVSMGEWMAERTEECMKLQKEIDNYTMAENSLDGFNALLNLGKEKANRPISREIGKQFSVSDQIFQGDDWEAFREKRSQTRQFMSEINADIKTLFETTSSGAVNNVSIESVRTGEFEMLPRTRVTIFDIIPQASTSNPSVKYDAEVLNQSAMAAIAQGAVYQESAFRIDEVSVDVGKSGAFIQVSEELMNDMPEFRARIDGSLMQQLMRRSQDDIIGGVPINDGEYVGTPVANAGVVGFLDVPAANINVIDGSGLNQISVIEDGAEMVYRLGQGEADAILMNSQDWAGMKKLQSTTGSFILRGANAPLSAPVERAIDEWRVVLCNSLPQGTVIIGDFANHCMLRDRQAAQVRIQEAQQVPVVGANVPVFTQPSGRYNVFADVRYAFYVRRGMAFTRITDFGTP